MTLYEMVSRAARLAYKTPRMLEVISSPFEAMAAVANMISEREKGVGEKE
jgi:hypothetical protein